jgi:hypothetical protein
MLLPKPLPAVLCDLGHDLVVVNVADRSVISLPLWLSLPSSLRVEQLARGVQNPDLTQSSAASSADSVTTSACATEYEFPEQSSSTSSSSRTSSPSPEVAPAAPARADSPPLRPSVSLRPPRAATSPAGPSAAAASLSRPPATEIITPSQRQAAVHLTDSDDGL